MGYGIAGFFKGASMNKPEWIEYIGSDEQIEEMLFAANKHGVMIIHHNGELCPGIFTDANELSQHLDKRTEYPIKMFWLCQPHPYADLICHWARTGQPVWIRILGNVGINCAYSEYRWTGTHSILITNAPDWNIPGAEYSFTEFKEEV